MASTNISKYGVLWYKERGLSLPRRCPDCIKGGRRNGSKPGAQRPGSDTQTKLCDMHDPEAVDALMCSVEGASINQYAVEGVYSADVGPQVAAATVSWCVRCNAQFELTASWRHQILCGNCIDWNDIDFSSGLDVEIVPSAAGSTSLMLELSDSMFETDTGSEEDLDQPAAPIGAPTMHNIHADILGQWSGLALHPLAFATACDSIGRFFRMDVPMPMAD